MIKKNAKNIILVLFVVITGIFYIDSFMRSGVEEDYFTDIYLYLWNCNLNIVFTIVFLVVFQELCVMDSYKKIFNRFDRYIITRVGYVNFYKKRNQNNSFKKFSLLLFITYNYVVILLDKIWI